MKKFLILILGGIFFNQKILCHVSARRTIAETVEFM